MVSPTPRGAGVAGPLTRLRRGWRAAVAAVLTTLAALAVYLVVATPTYTATAVVALLPQPGATASGELVRISVPTYARLATSDAVAAALNERYDVDRVEVTRATKAVVPPGTNTVIVSVRWDEPSVASELANGVVDELLTFSGDDPLLTAILVAPALPPAGPGFPPTELVLTVGVLLAVGAGGAAAAVATRGEKAPPSARPTGTPPGAGPPPVSASGPTGRPDDEVSQPADSRSAVEPDLRG